MLYRQTFHKKRNKSIQASKRNPKNFSRKFNKSRQKSKQIEPWSLKSWKKCNGLHRDKPQRIDGPQGGGMSRPSVEEKTRIEDWWGALTRSWPKGPANFFGVRRGLGPIPKDASYRVSICHFNGLSCYCYKSQILPKHWTKHWFVCACWL